MPREQDVMGEERTKGEWNEPAEASPEGYGALREVMGAIRASLEAQGQRHEEMVSYLSRLPELANRLPEQQEVQAEALKAVSKQLQQQIHQQTLLMEILEKVSQSTAEQRQLMEAVSSRVESLNQTEAAVTENLRQLGASLENVGRNSEAEAELLRQLQQSVQDRDGRASQMLQQHGTRTTGLLAVAIVLSIVAIAAVVASTFLLWQKLPG